MASHLQSISHGEVGRLPEPLAACAGAPLMKGLALSSPAEKVERQLLAGPLLAEMGHQEMQGVLQESAGLVALGITPHPPARQAPGRLHM